MSARSLLIISLLASIIAASHCNPASNKCRHDCRTEADCLNKKSQDKDEDCLKHKAGGYCNRGVKCGQPCNSSADCTPPEGGQCWAEVTCGKCNFFLTTSVGRDVELKRTALLGIAGLPLPSMNVTFSSSTVMLSRVISVVKSARQRMIHNAPLDTV